MIEQLPALGLVQSSLIHALTQDMQLGLAERPFQSQQQAVIVVARVVQPIVIRQQGVEQGAQFQQLIPVPN
jgi:hypothetical protein